MRIGASDQAELVGVDPEFGFHLEAVPQRRTPVLEFQHLGLLGDGEIEVALVPDLEVRELVVRRQERMRFAVALDLRHLVERLPAHPVLGIFAVDPRAGEQLDDREHDAVAQIAVVREREDFGAGLFLGRRHPLPQVARIRAAERRQRRVRLDQRGLGAAVAPDDIAMQIVSAGVRGPLIADEGGEAAGLVRLLRRLDGLAPGAAVGGRARKREALRHLALAEAGDDVDGGLRAFAGIDLVVPFPSLRRREQGRIAADQQREKAHAVGVVRDHEEVERPRELGPLPARRHDLLALGEAIGVLGRKPRAECARVHRERGVRVRVAEVRPRREIAPRVGRVRRLRRETPSRPSPCRACRCRWWCCLVRRPPWQTDPPRGH